MLNFTNLKWFFFFFCGGGEWNIWPLSTSHCIIACSVTVSLPSLPSYLFIPVSLCQMIGYMYICLGRGIREVKGSLEELSLYMFECNVCLRQVFPLLRIAKLCHHNSVNKTTYLHTETAQRKAQANPATASQHQKTFQYFHTNVFCIWCR